MIPSPPLRYLARAKLRGTVRKQWRRMKTAKGLLMTVLGVGLFVLWMSTVFFHSVVGPTLPEDLPDRRTTVGLMALFFTVLSMSSALAHRGLYLPKEEIERLFAAPLERADLVRYRLLNTLGRSCLGATIVGVVAMRRMPNPLFAFVGAFVAVATLPVFNQLLAILSGNLAHELARRLRRVPFVIGAVAVVGVILGIPLYILTKGEISVDALAQRLDPQGRSLAELPVVHLVIAPFTPWVRMVTARNLGEFVPWLGVSVGIWLGLAELAARLPIDFREVSLQTAANIAQRIHRARRGGGAASTMASRSMARMRVPRFFGRGPAGAIAWRKLTAMVRKAKGTLWVSGLVLLFVTVLSWAVGQGDPLRGPVLIAVLGTIYLCAGLRFDFRDELDRMEVIKAWPLAPHKIFGAMLLPEICMVSGLLFVAIVARILVGGQFHPAVVGVLVLIPPVVCAWVALDNIVFLFAPVRFVPGQEGALQNAGRGALMLLLRLVALSIVAVAGGGPAFVAGWFVRSVLGGSKGAAVAVGACMLFAALVVLDLALVWVGGLVLGRFDVARDRG